MVDEIADNPVQQTVGQLRCPPAADPRRWASQTMRSVLMFAGFCWSVACIHAMAASSVTKEQEQAIVRSLAPFAKREGDVLTLRSVAGRKIKFRDSANCDAAETCSVHRLLGTSRDKRFFVVESLGYESRTVYWIGRNSGRQHEVYAEPEMSPNERWVVTANPSELGGTNGVFIWEVRENRLVKRLHVEPTDYALYSFVRWKGNDAVVLEKFSHAQGPLCKDAKFMKIMVTIAREGKNWRFDESTGRKNVLCE